MQDWREVLLLGGSDVKMIRSFAVMQGWREGLIPGGSDAGLDRRFATWRK